MKYCKKHRLSPAQSWAWKEAEAAHQANFGLKDK